MEAEIKNVVGHFKNGEIGREILWFESIDSTNAYALQLPEKEFIHGTVIVAGSQTRGRGRQGRSWLSLADKGLYFTVMLSSSRPARETPVISFLASLALYEALSDYCDGKLDIKWPNDILLDGKKICGILGEMRIDPNGCQRIALGMSVNISHQKNDFPEAFRDRSTSILLSGKKNPGAAAILKAILERLNVWNAAFNQGDIDKIISSVTACSSYVSGKRIVVDAEVGSPVTGTTAGLNPDGSLQLRLDQGMEITLRAGEVHLL